MDDNTQSLPSSEEVLICTSDTTAEEVGIVRFKRLPFSFIKFYQNFYDVIYFKIFIILELLNNC